MRPSFVCTNLTQGRRRRHSTKHHFESESISTFLLWYNSLTEESQKHDILQLIVSCLNGRELYYLAILLLSRQYRDFIGDLPEVVSLKILSLITGKDLMKFCAVSQKWYQRCSNEKLWKMKCSQTSIGVPIQGISSWKKVFINNVKMKRNWRAGNASVMTLASHSHRVLCTRIDEMGGICASAGTDKTIKIWSLQDNTLLNTIQNCNLKNIWCVIFYGTNFIITGSGDSSVRIWNYRTGNCERCLQGHTGTVWAVRQKGDYLISGSHDKTAVLWNIRQCKYITHLIGHSGDVFAVDINDTLTIALTGSGDKTVRMWNVSDGLCFKVISTNIHQPVISLHSSKDYCVYCNGSVITLISLSSGCMIKTFRGHQDRVECVHMNIDGCNYDTIISGSRDHTIKYWNINRYLLHYYM
jgi:F-box/WD-40 domain protein 7